MVSSRIVARINEWWNLHFINVFKYLKRVENLKKII